jgi:hypothetical protein
VTGKRNVGHRDNEGSPLAFKPVMRRGVQPVHGRESGVERSENFEVNEFVGKKVLQSFWKPEDCANATSAVTYRRQKAC